MDLVPALKLALDLVQLPSLVRVVRAASLPDDLLVLLRIAAGDEKTTHQAVKASGRSVRAVREAAGFFIEQALLHPDADSYRVLGASPGATNSELRRNMALLLRWLHPDVDGDGERSVFAAKVTGAWNDLKTPERRAAHDRSMEKSLAEQSRLRERKTRSLKRGSRRSRIGHAGIGPYARPHRLRNNHPPGLLRRLLLFLFGRTVY